MGFSGTDILRQQRGVVRIDLAAMVLLLMALSIVLFTYLPRTPEPAAVQTGELIQALPIASTDPTMLAVPLLLPAVDEETDTL
ncbi:MAG: hypothetical protein QGG54_02160 [Gammaproteobacteria bacterium]|jgi:hypothetical protein|nr:hypothetical protein [Gammaproteobacteria bacterium]MDP6673850.1 hypothetical protein [Gammaproteobacteria bacterium]